MGLKCYGGVIFHWMTIFDFGLANEGLTSHLFTWQNQCVSSIAASDTQSRHFVPEHSLDASYCIRKLTTVELGNHSVPEFNGYFPTRNVVLTKLAISEVPTSRISGWLLANSVSVI